MAGCLHWGSQNSYLLEEQKRAEINISRKLKPPLYFLGLGVKQIGRNFK